MADLTINHHVFIHHDEHHRDENGHRELLREIKDLQQQITDMEQRIMVELDTLKASIAAEDTVIDSCLTLLTGLSQQLKDAIAALPNKQELVDLANQIDAKKQAIADAVVANTPAAPSP